MLAISYFTLGKSFSVPRCHDSKVVLAAVHWSRLARSAHCLALRGGSARRRHCRSRSGSGLRCRTPPQPWRRPVARFRNGRGQRTVCRQGRDTGSWMCCLVFALRLSSSRRQKCRRQTDRLPAVHESAEQRVLVLARFDNVLGLQRTANALFGGRRRIRGAMDEPHSMVVPQVVVRATALSAMASVLPGHGTPVLSLIDAPAQEGHKRKPPSSPA